MDCGSLSKHERDNVEITFSYIIDACCSIYTSRGAIYWPSVAFGSILQLEVSQKLYRVNYTLTCAY